MRQTISANETKRKTDDESAMMISKVAFAKVVRHVFRDSVSHGCRTINQGRFSKQAVLCLQEATEAYLVNLIKDACACATHAKRKTLKPLDLQLVKRLRGEAFSVSNKNVSGSSDAEIEEDDKKKDSSTVAK